MNLELCYLLNICSGQYKFCNSLLFSISLRNVKQKCQYVSNNIFIFNIEQNTIADSISYFLVCLVKSLAAYKAKRFLYETYCLYIVKRLELYQCRPASKAR